MNTLILNLNDPAHGEQFHRHTAPRIYSARGLRSLPLTNLYEVARVIARESHEGTGPTGQSYPISTQAAFRVLLQVRSMETDQDDGEPERARARKERRAKTMARKFPYNRPRREAKCYNIEVSEEVE